MLPKTKLSILPFTIKGILIDTIRNLIQQKRRDPSSPARPQRSQSPFPPHTQNERRKWGRTCKGARINPVVLCLASRVSQGLINLFQHVTQDLRLLIFAPLPPPQKPFLLHPFALLPLSKFHTNYPAAAFDRSC